MPVVLSVYRWLSLALRVASLGVVCLGVELSFG